MTTAKEKAMTNKEVIENFATFEQAQKYSLAYIHIYNVTKAYAKQEKKHIFQCSKKGKQDMALNSMEQLLTIMPDDPLNNVASAKVLDYVINFLKAHDNKIVLLPKIVEMMLDELIKYFGEKHRITKDEKYLIAKEGTEAQKWMWEGMLKIRHAKLTPTATGFEMVE